MNKRKCEPVIEPGLRGEREPHLVFLALAGRPDLHVACQHRVGWSQGGPEQECGRDAEPEQDVAENGEREDRQWHCDAEQSPGQTPRSPRERAVELQPRAHQGDDDHELGHVLHERELVLRMVGAAGHILNGEHRGAERDAQDRQRQGKLPEHHGQPGRQQHHKAEARQDHHIGTHRRRTRPRLSQFRFPSSLQFRPRLFV